MGPALLFLVLVSVVARTFGAGSICPAPESISPCTCDGEGVNCWHAKDIETIRRVFQTEFPAGGVRGLWIQDSRNITRLPTGIFKKLMVQKFHLDNNGITEVESGAFEGSENVVQSISLYDNKVSVFPWDDLQRLRLLETLNLAKNELTDIPSHAFGPHNSLNAIYLSYNRISHIGENVFNRLPNLQTVDLSFNSLKTLGPLSLAMNGHLEGLQISLMNNEIDTIEDDAFEGTTPSILALSNNKLKSLKQKVFMPMVTTMARSGRGLIAVDGNPMSCKGCDYSWVVINQRVLQYFLRGLTCPDESGLIDLTEDNIECDY